MTVYHNSSVFSVLLMFCYSREIAWSYTGLAKRVMLHFLKLRVMSVIAGRNSSYYILYMFQQLSTGYDYTACYDLVDEF